MAADCGFPMQPRRVLCRVRVQQHVDRSMSTDACRDGVPMVACVQPDRHACNSGASAWQYRDAQWQPRHVPGGRDMRCVVAVDAHTMAAAGTV